MALPAACLTVVLLLLYPLQFKKFYLDSGLFSNVPYQTPGRYHYFVLTYILCIVSSLIVLVFFCSLHLSISSNHNEFIGGTTVLE
jgi:uncharacterized membrane protein